MRLKVAGLIMSLTSSIAMAQNATGSPLVSMVQQEINDLGSVVGIPGGVQHPIVQNQREGEDCWAHATMGWIESILKNSDHEMKLAPEYLQFWHIYQQIQMAMPNFIVLVNALKVAPNSPQTAAAIDQISKTYGLMGKSRQLMVGATRASAADSSTNTVRLQDLLTIPSVGNTGALAIAELNKFGFVSFQQFPVRIKTAKQEQALEDGISQFVGQLLIDAIQGRTGLEGYIENSTGQLNLNLVARLRAKLEPIYGQKVSLPTDTYVDIDGKTTSALQNLNMLKAAGVDPIHDLSSVKATTATHQNALQAIAYSLLTQNQPVMFGFIVYNDDFANLQMSVQGFSSQYGLFTSKYCAQANCTSIAGGHEVMAVNFRAKPAAGFVLPANATRAQMASYVLSGNLQVTALIIENSWGPLGGTNIDGVIPNISTESGYYVLASDYLANSFNVSEDPGYDFLLPTAVQSKFPNLQ